VPFPSITYFSKSVNSLNFVTTTYFLNILKTTAGNKSSAAKVQALLWREDNPDI
jgi:hypothetical protein